VSDRITAAPRQRLGRPPKAQASDTRAAVLDAALTLFARHGFGGTSMRAIAQVVGVTEAALYRHFPSKRAIFDEVLSRAGSGLLAARRGGGDAALADTDPQAFLHALAEGLLRAWDTPQSRKIASVIARGLGETHLQVIAATEQVTGEIGGLFARWIEQGHIDPAQGTPERLAWELFAPTAYVRLLYLHAEADAATRIAGGRLIRQHLQFFITAVFDGRHVEEMK
jgi:AcrR family transcriptional regulator